MMAFILLGSINFYLLYTAGTKRKLSPIKNSDELKFYLVTILIISAICALSLFIHNGYSLERSIRTAMFNCISIASTSGFLTDD